ncbi:MAG TPA: formyltransferase family protein [Candidatus Hydrogenedentes bacterium]|nr:formyltransferase family protein [Candidatus Hydrogenedentota bacterium]HPG66008.1 formyltransferase family protein [Candidatus Hydrogenedentota bacterium]
MAKSVILLGKGELARRIAGWFHESPDYNLVRVVPVIPEPKWTASLKEWADAHGVPTVDSGHFKDIPGVEVEDWTIDLAFSCFYDRIIKKWFIDKCGRILNLHNAPLPKYRGVSPINWALKNEEPMHGVTIHEITPGIDDGPVVSQVQYSLYPAFDEVKTVYGRALEFAWTLFQQTMPMLDQIVARPQDNAQATYYSAKENHLLQERRYFTREESLQRLAGH